MSFSVWVMHEEREKERRNEWKPIQLSCLIFSAFVWGAELLYLGHFYNRKTMVTIEHNGNHRADSTP